MAPGAELLPGNLDLVILKAISLGEVHGYGVLLRIEQISGGAILAQQGALYPALYRLEHQGVRFPTLSNTGNAAWYEIVGVVGPLGVNVVNADRGEAVYLPAAPGTINPMQLAIHALIPPAGLTGRVREIAMAVDPDLVLGRTAVLSDVQQGDWYLVMGLAAGLVVLVGVLIALAISGLYAMLSLSVSERTREIGIRAALGASRRALLTTILRRSLVQIGLGAVIGLPIAARFVFELTGTPGGGGSVSQSMAVALGLSTAIVALVGLASCLVPTRRIMGIQASEAMHADG